MAILATPKFMLSVAMLLHTALATLSPNLLSTRASSCQNFTASGNSYTQPASGSTIVSPGVVCPSTENCTVIAGGWVTDTRTLNITTSDASSLFTLISSVEDYTFNETASYRVEGNNRYTFTVPNGTAGYVAFTVNHRCASGVLSGCTGDVADGTAVEACTPLVSAGGLSGTFGLVTTDEETAESVTCNPANTTTASQAPNEACLSGNSSSSDGDSNTSGAGSSVWWGDSVWLGLGCAGLLAFGGAF